MSFADVAIERNYEYYFWGHSDVVVFPQNATVPFAEVAVACAEAAMSAKPNWGIMYFMYDWFSAIRTDLVRQVSLSAFVPGVNDQIPQVLHLEFHASISSPCVDHREHTFQPGVLKCVSLVEEGCDG